VPNPYARLPAQAFWRAAIADKKPREIRDLWKPKHPFERPHKVATFGSCFAKYFRHALKTRGYNWFDAERPPEFFTAATRNKFNYHIFSARTGDIQTVAALRQWVSWSLSSSTPPDEVWETKGRFFDPFRPSIEPDGFATVEELLANRTLVLRAIHNVVVNADWLVFSLGSTEGWISSSRGYNYAQAPGIVAGDFDVNMHSFKNYTFAEITADLSWVIRTIHSFNNKMRFLLTVSAIPLNETASGKHVLTASTYSKSVLRAVAGTLADSMENVDYFPSYELIATAPFKGMFYEPNQRSPSNQGMTFVTDSFFACLAHTFGATPPVTGPAAIADRNPREFWTNVLATRRGLRGFI
jgi:hypothetical protein